MDVQHILGLERKSGVMWVSTHSQGRPLVRGCLAIVVIKVYFTGFSLLSAVEILFFIAIAVRKITMKKAKSITNMGIHNHNCHKYKYYINIER